jgi:hypothetical protein
VFRVFGNFCTQGKSTFESQLLTAFNVDILVYEFLLRGQSNIGRPPYAT